MPHSIPSRPPLRPERISPLCAEERRGCVCRIQRRARRAFTLIELLTVIAIVGILVALIVMGTKAVRQQARTAKCMGQLRGLWNGMIIFTQDHQGRFPSVNIENAATNSNPGFREYVGYSKNVFESTPYSCPEAQQREGGQYASGGNMCRTYSVGGLMVYNWNTASSYKPADALGYYSRASSPAKTLYLVDGLPNPGSEAASGKGINYYSNVAASTVAGLPELHGGKVNVLYLDGHAVSVKRVDLELPKTDILWSGSQ